ncbi:MAG: tRNA lysidine(34) synthetase TilS [Candidatus Omnitrophica bacterium]|nr:tRNA lysidine(34) synthetase TilS [Candidatus Omnitrophota bacterium]MCM8790416.1 tRNA lysidine(34) synthetase TilS [Candidatus Omnitrophota bacterium]
MPDVLIEQVLKTVRNYELMKNGDCVMLAVSGGPDSVFMLHAIASLGKKLGLKSLSVCNLDHGLRGKESAEDSDFVRRMANRYGLPFFHNKIKIMRSAADNLSVEELARQARYQFFKEAALRAGAGVVATGHTLDDQAETVLMRLIKGSSMKGVVGIAPKRQEGVITVVRPLIEIEKKQIVRYLEAAGIPYRVDSTNLEDIFFRNVVRNEIMPFLERYNPRLKRALFSFAEHLREDFEFISEARRKLGRSLTKSGGGQLEILLKDFVIQPKALQKEILRDCLEKSGGEVKRLSFRHWKELDALIRQKRKGSSVDLPGGIRVSRTERCLKFIRN